MLNEDKFDGITFGKDDTLKHLFSLFSIEALAPSKNIRDLVLIVERNASWSAVINSKVDMPRRMPSWILRTLQLRDITLLSLSSLLLPDPNLNKIVHSVSSHEKCIMKIEAFQR